MSAIAILSNHGTIRFIQHNHKGPTLIIFNLRNFEPFSTHAIHIHEFGDTTDGCTSLGGHYNPEQKNHGSLVTNDRHVGDLINNFTSDANGEFYLEYNDFSIRNIRDIYGRSIVIHYLEDDLGLGLHEGTPYSQLSDPTLITLCKERGYKDLKDRGERINKLNKESLITGNAGKRLVCGIIGISDKKF